MAVRLAKPRVRLNAPLYHSIIRGEHKNGTEVARHPTAGSEARGFASCVERGRVPFLFEKSRAAHGAGGSIAHRMDRALES